MADQSPPDASVSPISSGPTKAADRILPFNPKSPDVHVVTATVAASLRAAALGKLDEVVDGVLAIPLPRRLQWGEGDFECDDTSWQTASGVLELQLRRPTLRSDEKLDAMFRVMNLPATFQLERGGSLKALLVHLTGRQENIDIVNQRAVTTHTIILDSWTWVPPRDTCLWVGRVHGVSKIDDGNLAICAAGSWSGYNLSLSGRYDLYLVQNRKAKTTILVVDTHGQEFDHETLGVDFMALEFSLGRALRLDHVVAIDDTLEVVGGAGLGFGTGVEDGRTGRCPVAASLDLYANFDRVDAEHMYVPAMFSLIAQAIRDEGPDSAIVTAVAAYLEATEASSIHASYLLVQVALEALAAEMTEKTSGVLVSDPAAWLAFVDSNEAAIRHFGRDDEAATKLVNKVRNALQAPSTDRVATALRQLELEVPEAALKEIPLRNKSAHRYVMAKESEADVQQLADRLAIVQTLLVALIAKRVSFRGPIIGWEWVRGRHKIPTWWPWEPLPEARRRWLVTPEWYVEAGDANPPSTPG
jgi:hypothetical protein